MKVLRKLHRYINKERIKGILSAVPRNFLSAQTGKEEDVASIVLKTVNKKQVTDFERKLDLLEDYLMQPQPRPRTEKSISSFKTSDFKHYKSLTPSSNN